MANTWPRGCGEAVKANQVGVRPQLHKALGCRELLALRRSDQRRVLSLHPQVHVGARPAQRLHHVLSSTGWSRVVETPRNQAFFTSSARFSIVFTSRIYLSSRKPGGLLRSRLGTAVVDGEMQGGALTVREVQ